MGERKQNKMVRIIKIIEVKGGKKNNGNPTKKH